MKPLTNSAAVKRGCVRRKSSTWHPDPRHPDPIPGLANPDGPGAEEYTVGRIVTTRIRHRRRQWLVEWRGYTSAHRTWEPLESFLSDGSVTQALRKFERDRTGSDQHLMLLLHASPMHTEYNPGLPGATATTGDAYNVTYALPDESPAQIATRSGAPLADIMAFNRPLYQRLRKTTRLPAGTAMRTTHATLSAMFLAPRHYVQRSPVMCTGSTNQATAVATDVTNISAMLAFMRSQPAPTSWF